MEHVHFIGIGGVGMNGLAQLAAGMGYAVSGSDRAYTSDSPLFRSLCHAGVRMYPQDGTGIGTGTDLVVYSTAIEAENSDLAAAEKHGIPLLHRAEFLNRLVGSADLIAVAGTAGKTTTTGMLGWIFECLGMNPSVYNGAAVLNWKDESRPGNVRKGSSDLWLIEADESDRSFLHFHPTHTIITNITEDHFKLDELHALFDRFRTQTSGHIVNGDDIALESAGANRFIFKGTEFEVPVPGRHNLENALCAVRLCAELDMDMNAVRDALLRFRGIERRLEVVGRMQDITVIDDYAHNPAKLRAALSAAAETGSRVHAYWRPHGYTPLFQGKTALSRVFADHWNTNKGSIFILPVYYAGGTVDRKISAEELVDDLVSAGVPAQFVPDYDALKSGLETCARSGDVILGMGARDPELPVFAKRLVYEWKKN
jgi:UDP-N-acetylmuramate--alanine ligase